MYAEQLTAGTVVIRVAAVTDDKVHGTTQTDNGNTICDDSLGDEPSHSSGHASAADVVYVTPTYRNKHLYALRSSKSSTSVCMSSASLQT